MATAVLRPGAVGAYDAWSLGAGGSKVAACDPGSAPSHDDGSTFINAVTNPAQAYQSFSILAASIPSGLANVNSLTSWIRVYQQDPGDGKKGLRTLIRRSGSDGLGASNLVTAFSTWQSFSDAIARPGGGSWVVADIDPALLEIGVVASGGGLATSQDCTSVWAVLDFDFTRAGFISLVAQWLGPLVSVGLNEMPGLAVDLWRHTAIRLSPAEYLWAWRGLREHAYRVYSS